MTLPSNTPALPPDPDQELVARCCAGQRRAFDRLVLKYQDMIVSLCVRLLGNRPDGEDAAQDVFVKAFHNLSAFRGQAKFSTWLYSIAVNTCRNKQQSFWRRLWKTSVKLDAPIHSEDGDSAPRELGDTSMLPSKDLERKRTVRAIQTGLATLTPRHRELVILRDVKDMSYDDIATTTGMNPGTVKSGIARAREAMRRALEGTIDER